MVAAILGPIGLVMFALAYGAAEKSGYRVLVFSVLGLVCFAGMLFGTPLTPGYLLECDDYSRFASSC